MARLLRVPKSCKHTRPALEAKSMKYGIAWLLGVPASVLIIWFVISHLL